MTTFSQIRSPAEVPDSVVSVDGCEEDENEDDEEESEEESEVGKSAADTATRTAIAPS